MHEDSTGETVRRTTKNSQVSRWIIAIVGSTLLASTWATGALAANSTPAGRYIVALTTAPLAVHPSTKPAPGEAMNLSSEAAASHTEEITRSQDDVLHTLSARPSKRYSTALNGFAVDLTAAEVQALEQRLDVISVTPDEPVPLTRVAPTTATVATTDRSPDVLGLTGPSGAWAQVGGAAHAGEGQVIGIVDSGIDWSNPSFDPEGMPPAPEDFSGRCEVGDDFARWPPQACNRKIIGAQNFDSGVTAAGDKLTPQESASPLDTDGHGSHVAGIAVGRGYNYDGPDGTFKISGVAPMAHVAIYKACWDIARLGQTMCYPQDSIAAVEAAVEDGVDVLNYSVAGSGNTYHDAVDLAFSNAADVGVFVSTAGGNNGDSPGQVEHPAPWVTTVSAANHRSTRGKVPGHARFSSRGPVGIKRSAQTVLKPDLGAPGQHVFSALRRTPLGQSDWYYQSGTSMASPHVAGAAALVRQRHPSWSPMAIKSALMTSSSRYAEPRGNDPFSGGAGFLAPDSAMTPGLVFDSDLADWTEFLDDPDQGAALNAAYVQIPRLDSQGPRTVTRTLRNVGTKPVTYRAEVDSPAGLDITVDPETIKLTPGASAEVEVSVSNLSAPRAAWQRGVITWSGPQQPNVRIPVVARGYAVKPADPELVTRWAGANRYETAAVIAEEFSGPIDTVYLSSGRSFPDALTASPLAARGVAPQGVRTGGYPAPILLTTAGALPLQTREALESINPKHVVILGGEGVVSTSVRRDLNARGYAVTRVGGVNRYDTSAQLSAAYRVDVPVVYVASGTDGSVFDVLSGSALAATDGAPLLLTRPDSVPPEITQALDRLNPDRIVVLGGESAVSADVYRALGASERISGSTRYATSAEIAGRFRASPKATYVVSGHSWPDALSASVIAGASASPMLMTDTDEVPPSVLARIRSLAPAKIVMIGGEEVIDAAVEHQLNKTPPPWR